MKVDGSQSPRPYAYADPRSLSRAWFDALYGQRSTAPRAAVAQAPLQRPAASAADAHHRCSENVPQAAAAPAMARTPLAATTPGPPLRGAGQTIAVSARERIGTAPPPQEQRGGDAERGRFDVALATPDGAPIRLLVAGGGERVDVVAITSAACAANVGDALEAAQSTLAARGIAVSLRLMTTRYPA